MSCLRVLGRMTAVCIIFLFVVVTPPLILSHNVQNAVLDSAYLDDVLEDPEIFEDALQEAAQKLPDILKENPDTRTMPVAQLSTTDWERALNTILPPEDLQDWAQDAVDGFRTWLRSDEHRLVQIVIPFGEIRDNIVEDREQTFLRILTEAQPPCREGQNPLPSEDDFIPECRPPGDLVEFYRRLGQSWSTHPRDVWRQLWPEAVARFDDDVTLADWIDERSEERWEDTAGWRSTRWTLRAVGWLLVVVLVGQAVIAMGLVALLAARSWREAFRWVGTPVILAGAFTVLLAIAVLVAWDIGITFIPEDNILRTGEALDEAVRSFSNAVWPPMIWQGGLLVLIGVGLWLLSLLFPPTREWEPLPEPIPATRSGEAPAPEPSVPAPVEPSGPATKPIGPIGTVETVTSEPTVQPEIEETVAPPDAGAADTPPLGLSAPVQPGPQSLTGPETPPTEGLVEEGVGPPAEPEAIEQVPPDTAGEEAPTDTGEAEEDPSESAA